MPYHAAYLFDTDARRQVMVEHQEMIEVLVDHDNARLIELMNEHRRGGEAGTDVLLRRARADT